MAEFRKWQLEADAKFAASEHKVFLANALPGAGKTIAAGLIARRRFLDVHRGARLVVVVPTDHMRSQWQGVMSARFGIQLDDQISPMMRSGMHGLVTTYAGMAINAEKIARFASGAPTLGICDEVHHAGDTGSWGAALVQALDPCRRLLMLSGTPFRHDETRIPFLRVRSTDLGEEYIADVEYDFAEALRDRVVRALTFQGFDGTARYLDKALELSSSLEDATEAQTSTVLRILLNDEGYVRGLLEAAHARLLEQRERIPDAGGLAIAIDSKHAQFVAGLLADVTGEAPAIVVSDEDVATASVKGFGTDARRRWIVAVRMVSEGVDIPRLMTLAMLTNVSTRLYFRQAVGRVVRRRGDFDPLAHVFLPASRPLMKHAREIEAICSIAPAQDDLPQEPEPEEEGEGGDGPMRRKIVVLGVDEIGLAGSINKGHDGSLELGFAPAAQAEIPLAERMEMLRAEIQQLVSRYARMNRKEPRAVHSDYKKRCRVPQARMSLSQLQAKRDHFARLIGLPSVSASTSTTAKETTTHV